MNDRVSSPERYRCHDAFGSVPSRGWLGDVGDAPQRLHSRGLGLAGIADKLPPDHCDRYNDDHHHPTTGARHHHDPGTDHDHDHDHDHDSYP